MTHPPHTYGQNKKAKAPKTLAKNFKKRATEIYAPKKGAPQKQRSKTLQSAPPPQLKPIGKV
jgi:hypothetical protein